MKNKPIIVELLYSYRDMTKHLNEKEVKQVAEIVVSAMERISTKD
jgi:hypothetical protein